MRNYEDNERNGARLGLIIGLGVVGVILFIMFSIGGWFIGTYNNLVDMDENVSLAEAKVETMMQRRLELIPDLEKVVMSAAKHEENITKDIANARAGLTSALENGDAQEINEANSNFSKEINNLIQVIHENYPQLTTGEQYTSLMDQIEGSINRITTARESYNEQVSEYNRVVRKFPGSLLANIYGFEKAEEFKADAEAERTSLLIDMDKE